MHNALARIEGTSLNMANLTTAGYKRSVSVTQSFSDYLGLSGYGGAPTSPFPILLPGIGQVADFKNGGGKLTSNPLDLATSGGGHFPGSTPSRAAFTPQGQFRPH